MTYRQLSIFRRWWRVIFVALSCFLACCPATAQAIKSRFDPEVTHCFPFITTLKSPVPILDIFLDDMPLKAVLDTGSSFDFIMRESLVEKLKLKITKRNRDSNLGRYNSVQCDNFRMKGVDSRHKFEFTDFPAISLLDKTFDDISFNLGNKIDVIIGTDFLIEGYKFQIDFIDKQLRITNFKYKNNVSDAKSLKFEMKGSRPHIDLKNKEGVVFSAVIDTGSNCNLFDKKFFPKEFEEGKVGEELSFLTSRRIHSKIAMGSFHWGDHLFEHETIYLSKDTPLSVIGSNFLKDKVITFDHSVGMVYIEWGRSSLIQLPGTNK